MRTINQVAELFNVSPRAVQTWIYDYGHLKASRRFGKSLMFTDGDLRTFIEVRVEWFESKAEKYVITAERLEDADDGRAVGRALANAHRLWGRADAM